jgi:hypothetical protein
MAKTLTVNNVPFEYPEAGDPPGWGEEATGWAEEVTDTIGALVGPNDILESSATILNNQSIPQDISGLVIDPAQVRRVEVKYSIYRVTDDEPSGHAEEGTLFAVYDNSAPVNEKFKLSGEFTGFSGVDIELLDSGQFQYTSTNIPGLNYAGIMRFTAQIIESTL